MKTVLALLALMLTARAAEVQPTVTVLGFPNTSCGAWVTYRGGNARVQAFYLELWVLGFLSGIGYAGSGSGLNPLNGVDADGVSAWIDNYCQAHPLDRIVEAATAFVKAHPH